MSKPATKNLNNIYKAARLGAGLTGEEAIEEIPVSLSQLNRYEDDGPNGIVPPPEIVLLMSKVYGAPWLTQVHCKRKCAIGGAYAFEFLDAIDSNPNTMLAKLRIELNDSLKIVEKVAGVVVNKKSRESFGETEWRKFMKAVAQLMRLEHCIETLKIHIGKWTDLVGIVQAHNQHCYNEGLITNKKTA